MRRLTIGLLAAGCLSLVIATIAVTLPNIAQAKDTGFRPDFQGCFDSGSANLCKNGKVMICHFNLGADTGKAKCQEESGGGPEGGYNAHISEGALAQGHGDRDFCIRNADEIADCEKGIIPPK